MRSVMCLALLATVLPAQQRLGPVEKRPALSADADTNDAQAYFAFGARMLENRPDQAAAAFYWAARLDPSSADALDGRRAALLMRKPNVLKMYMDGGRRARESKEFKAIDSLQLRALRLDPLYFRKYDHTMLMAYYRYLLRQDYPTASPGDIDLAIRDYLSKSSHYMRAWVSYSEGRMADAVVNYDAAIKVSKNPGGLRLERARTLVLQGLLPAALEDFRRAVTELRKDDDDKDERVVMYRSKALAEHSVGVIYAKLGQLDSARAALGRAITEDLAYYAAHVQLSQLALVAKDTATAVSELALAAELATDEPYVHLLRGNTLLAAGMPADALAPLRTSIELEPVYASAHFALAQALDKTGDAAGAKESYTRFLALASRRDQQRRAVATQRLTALAGTAKP